MHWRWGVWLLFVCSLARADEPDSAVHATTEDELVDQVSSEQLSSADELIYLLGHPVDLATAGRESLYALPGITLAEADAIVAWRRTHEATLPALVAAGLLTRAQGQAIGPFVGTQTPIWLRQTTLVTDGGVPGFALEAEARLGDFSVGGAALLTRARLGTISHEGAGLVAEAPGLQVHVPKLYARFGTGSFRVIAGSYRIGFAERLTFDDTPLQMPNGFIGDDVLLRSLQPGTTTPDLRWRDGLFGVAATLATPSWQVTSWLAATTRSIYQYDVVAPPQTGTAPPVRTSEDLAVAYQTLPDVWREWLAGGRLAWSADETHKLRAGLTAWTAVPEWLVPGLEFRDSAQTPAGGRYGALGADLGFATGAIDLGAEVSRTLDGALGAIARLTAGPPHQELELTVRAYGPTFKDPYAGAIAEPDQTGGVRVADEMGARLRYTTRLARTELRLVGDLWVTPSTETRKGVAYARLDQHLGAGVTIGLWSRLAQADSHAFELAATARWARGNGELGFQAENVQGDAPRTELWLLASWRPGSWRLHARSRMLVDQLTRRASVWSYGELAYTAHNLTARLRVDVNADPVLSSTWARLELEARF